MKFFSALFYSIVGFIVDLTEFKPWKDNGIKRKLKNFLTVLVITVLGFIFYLIM